MNEVGKRDEGSVVAIAVSGPMCRVCGEEYALFPDLFGAGLCLECDQFRDLIEQADLVTMMGIPPHRPNGPQQPRVEMGVVPMMRPAMRMKVAMLALGRRGVRWMTKHDDTWTMVKVTVGVLGFTVLCAWLIRR